MTDTSAHQNVVVLGASRKAERYSNKAIKRLMLSGHRVIPIHPLHQNIEGIEVKASLDDVSEPVDTLTVYVSPRHIHSEIDAICRLKPKRVILNPGTESRELSDRLDESGITWMHACTLVMLATDQF